MPKAKAAEEGRVGHVRERSPGRWELRLFVGRDPLTNKKRVETKTVSAATKVEAEYELLRWSRDVTAVGVSEDLTMKELLDKWFDQTSPYMVPSGRRETRWIIDRRLSALHHTRLSALAARTGVAVLDEFYAALRDRGGLCRKHDKCAELPCRHGDVCTLDGKCDRLPCEHGGGQALDDATVVRGHVVVRAALQQAVRWGLIDRNPAEHAFAGEPDEDEVVPPKPGDVVRMFELAEETDPELVVFLVMAATTGQRKGAVLALQWGDVDFETGIVTFAHVMSLGTGGPVRVPRGRSKRNKKGKKTIVPVDPSVLAILLAHRVRCEQKAAVGAVELGADAFVFPEDPDGSRPWHLQTVSRHFKKLRDATGLDDTRLHDLRHFVVSYLVKSGADLATVKALVGHAANSNVALDVYAHADLEQKREATGILARLLKLPATGTEPDPTPAPTSNVIPIRRRETA